MQKLKLKVCGMREPENIVQVAAVQPDYMGFIFYKKSKRYVEDSMMIPPLAESIQKVGVFVNAGYEEVITIVNRFGLKWIQLHGEESPDYCRRIKGSGVKIIKAFPVDERFDFNETEDFQQVADYFLFDTKGKLPGGNGVPFDWSLLDRYKGSIPFFLSGGISRDNLSDVKNIRHPQFYGIDINSGVEDAPGMKSLKKINELKHKLDSL